MAKTTKTATYGKDSQKQLTMIKTINNSYL